MRDSIMVDLLLIFHRSIFQKINNAGFLAILITNQPAVAKGFISLKKLKRDLKWKPKIELDEGINRCIDWIKKDLKLFSKFDENYIHKK